MEAKDNVMQRVETRDSYKAEYIKRKEALAAKVPKPPKQKPLPPHIVQAEAKTFLPPHGASIWLGVKRGEWCAHVPPSTRVTCPFTRYGNRQEALKECLRKVWAQWLEMQGLSDAYCPWAGLV